MKDGGCGVLVALRLGYSVYDDTSDVDVEVLSPTWVELRGVAVRRDTFVRRKGTTGRVRHTTWGVSPHRICWSPSWEERVPLAGYDALRGGCHRTAVRRR